MIKTPHPITGMPRYSRASRHMQHLDRFQRISARPSTCMSPPATFRIRFLYEINLFIRLTCYVIQILKNATQYTSNSKSETFRDMYYTLRLIYNHENIVPVIMFRNYTQKFVGLNFSWKWNQQFRHFILPCITMLKVLRDWPKLISLLFQKPLICSIWFNSEVVLLLMIDFCEVSFFKLGWLSIASMFCFNIQIVYFTSANSLV